MNKTAAYINPIGFRCRMCNVL